MACWEAQFTPDFDTDDADDYRDHHRNKGDPNSIQTVTEEIRPTEIWLVCLAQASATSWAFFQPLG
jgi:hypothetical protein